MNWCFSLTLFLFFSINVILLEDKLLKCRIPEVGFLITGINAKLGPDSHSSLLITKNINVGDETIFKTNYFYKIHHRLLELTCSPAFIVLD